MSEESKTARAARLAVERGSQSGKKELTTEERLANLKKNLDAGLYIPATEVKLLWESYLGALAEVLGARAALSINGLALDAEREQNERWQDEFSKMVEIRDSFVKQLDEAKAVNEKFYGLFSDYEAPCETYDQAEKMWNNLKEQLRDLQC